MGMSADLRRSTLGDLVILEGQEAKKDTGEEIAHGNKNQGRDASGDDPDFGGGGDAASQRRVGDPASVQREHGDEVDESPKETDVRKESQKHQEIGVPGCRQFGPSQKQGHATKGNFHSRTGGGDDDGFFSGKIPLGAGIPSEPIKVNSGVFAAKFSVSQGVSHFMNDERDEPDSHPDESPEGSGSSSGLEKW